jgi:hypothetical protein
MRQDKPAPRPGFLIRQEAQLTKEGQGVSRVRIGAICAVLWVTLFAGTAAAQSAVRPDPELPNAPSHVPLTDFEKFKLFGKRTYSPYTLASVAFDATYAHVMGDWRGYGGGMGGWGQRVGATYADYQASSFFRSFLLPTLLNQDPRYFPSPKKGFIPRTWYAASRVLITRNDFGREEFNYSQVLGTAFTKSVANFYYPEEDRGFGITVSRTFGSLLSDAGSNMLREFWPDIKRIVRRHTPKKIKKIQEKIPMDALSKAVQ